MFYLYFYIGCILLCVAYFSVYVVNENLFLDVNLPSWCNFANSKTFSMRWRCAYAAFGK